MSEVEAVPQTSEMKEETQEERKAEIEKALNLMSQGKRNMLCKEVPQAVNQFEEAVQILVSKYGTYAKECGDAHMSYGKSLLELYRLESGVIDNAIQGMEDKVEDEESKSESSEDKEEEEKTDEDNSTEASEELNTEEEEEGEGAKAEAEEEGDKKEGDEEDAKKEDPSNLQIAWEVFEVAKKIYSQEDDDKAKLKVADAHMCLAEVSLESEEYPTAIGDLKECLKIQETLLDAEDRRLAETHYQLGLAYTYSEEYDEAISSLKQAVSTMESRLTLLNKVIEDGKKEGKDENIKDFEDPMYKALREVKELEEIITDIRAKIDDVVEEKNTAADKKEQLKEVLKSTMEGLKGSEGGAGEGCSKTEDKPVTVITHLVRKKRKNEEEESEETSTSEESKKPRLENGSGDAPAANGTNGAASPEKKETETAMETSEEVKTKSVEEVKKTEESPKAETEATKAATAEASS